MEVFRQSVQDVLERVDIRRCRRSWADRKPTTPAPPDHDGAPHAFQSSSGIPPAPQDQFKTDKQSIGALLDTFNPRAAGRLGSQVSDSGVARKLPHGSAYGGVERDTFRGLSCSRPKRLFFPGEACRAKGTKEDGTELSCWGWP